MSQKDLEYLQKVENSSLEDLTLTKVHVEKGGKYGSWAGFHNQKGLGFCFELCYSMGDEWDDGGDYISVYKQTRIEAKLGLKGKKLDVPHIYDTPEYEALYPLMDRSKKIIEKEYSKVCGERRREEEKKNKKKQSKEVSYIRRVADHTK